MGRICKNCQTAITDSAYRSYGNYCATCSHRRRSTPEFKAAAVRRVKRWRDDNPDKLQQLRQREKQSMAYKLQRQPSPERSLKMREYNLRRLGSSLGHYAEEYEKQKGCCAICGNYQAKLVVDHCHTAQVYRGLLCNNCNLALGHIHDNADIALKLAQYLVNFKRSKENT